MKCGARKSFNNSMYSSMILNIPISSRPDDLHKIFKVFFYQMESMFLSKEEMPEEIEMPVQS